MVVVLDRLDCWRTYLNIYACNVYLYSTGLEISSIKKGFNFWRYFCRPDLVTNPELDVAEGQFQEELEFLMLSNEELSILLGRPDPVKYTVILVDCLFDLILYVPSTIFQLNRDGSSWVEPVLS